MSKNIYTIHENIKWIDVINPSQKEMEDISNEFGLNNHTIYDCMQPEHLPKYEMIDDVNFLILRFYAEDENKSVASIQELTNKIAIFYTAEFLITIHKAEVKFIEDVYRKYVEIKKYKTVTSVLAKIIWYALESFEEPANKLSAKIDDYENEVMFRQTSDDQMKALYYIKHKASISHKVLLLMGEPINHQYIVKGERSIVQDVKDQYLKILTLYGQLVDDVNNLINLTMSLAAKRTNDVMRILTVFSVFFMPLTFIVGVYGMNFKYMPELNWKYGYPLSLIFMALVTLVVYQWFKRKKWL